MIQSVQKAMKILSVISNAKNSPVTLTDISLTTGYPKPTCAHLLETLCYDGYAVRVSHSEGYRLGPSLYYLTRYGRYEEELVALCRPVMRWMERRLHATIILAVIQNHQKFIIDYADNEQHLFSEHPEMRTDDIYRTATGRAILAHLDKDIVREIYKKHGIPQEDHWKEVTSFDTLLEELAKIRNQSIVSTSSAERTVGGTTYGFASPLFRGSLCIGAIGIALNYPDNTAEEPNTASIYKVLTSGVKEIHRRLSYEN